MNRDLEQKSIDTIRFLCIDAVEKANSGHPGICMGAAPMAFALWSRHLRFNPRDPRWANRDRFVLSAGHGSMLIYAMLHLAGFDVTMDDIKSFRQYGSKTPGHPEFHDTPGVEATTGTLGQRLSNAVGMALSQRMLAARMNVGGNFPVDNFVYGICSDGDLMEGVTSEACSLAGHLKLGNLIFLYDDNLVSLAGHTDVTFTEDRDKRFEAYGWHVQHVADGNDVEAIDRAVRAAQKDPRPSMISVRTVLGYGSPHKASRQVPADLPEQLVSGLLTPNAPESTRKHGQAVLQKAAQLVPGLVGGSADLDPSTFTYLKDGGDVQPGNYAGRNIHFGVREHAMGAIVNGFSYDGFFTAYSATFLLFSDYMRPPIRLAALSRLPSIFVFTHDSIFLGEDGPTHQPIEQLAALRAIPNMEVWRPADGVETAASWAAAIGRQDGPSTLAFTRQKLPVLQRSAPANVRQALRGAYPLNDVEDPDLVIIATGSEVSTAQQALQYLDKSLKVRLVSMPCVERFLKWSGDDQRKLIPHGRARLVAVEAAGGLDWYRIIAEGLMVGIDRFGASAPDKALADAYDLTPQKVAGRISKWLATGARTNTK